jgi:hypothetical protein
MIVDAIKGKGKIEYSSKENPLDVEFLRISGIKSVMIFLSDLALNEDVEVNKEGFGVICKMMAGELDIAEEKLDKINLEICRAIDGLA